MIELPQGSSQGANFLVLNRITESFQIKHPHSTFKSPPTTIQSTYQPTCKLVCYQHQRLSTNKIPSQSSNLQLEQKLLMVQMFPGMNFISAVVQNVIIIVSLCGPKKKQQKNPRSPMVQIITMQIVATVCCFVEFEIISKLIPNNKLALDQQKSDVHTVD